VGNDLAHGVLQNTPIKVLISLWVLVGLCNTPNNVERYVIDLKAFMGYRTKILPFSSILLAMSNTLSIV
jgi:hypothetical protein